MSPKQSYPDIVLNAFKSVQAWKTLSMVLVGILIFETISLIWLARHQAVILIPQQLSHVKGPVKLNLGAPFSPEYLTEVARGDSFMLLNWTPENINEQYGAFLARLTPGLHSVQKESLLSEAKLHQGEGVTQSFHITRTYIQDNTATLHGVLIRAVAGREVFRGPAAYIFSYENGGNGLLLVNGVSQAPDSQDGRSKN